VPPQLSGVGGSSGSGSGAASSSSPEAWQSRRSGQAAGPSSSASGSTSPSTTRGPLPALQQKSGGTPTNMSGKQAAAAAASSAAGTMKAQGSSSSASASASGSRPGGSLASRRNFTGTLQVNTNKKDEKGPKGRRKIQWCANLRDRYKLGDEVMPSCHSGMTVLFGKQKTTGIEVVIKVRIKESSFKEDEEREWRASTEFMLNLPPSGNIAKLYEVLEDVDAYYVVMEKCAGQDLFESIHSSTKLTVDETKNVMFQILTALADLHAEGLVHKDLKLENVMIDRTPSTSTSAKKVWMEVESPKSPVAVKIVDFDTVEEHQPQTPKRAKDVLGTDQYIAQEAYAGIYSPASDVFAVGVIGFRLLVGKFPYDSKMFNDKPGENWVGSPKMREIREKLCKFKVNYEHKVFQREPQACALIRQMLSMRESDRPTAKEALANRWFASCLPDDRLQGSASEHSLPGSVMEGKRKEANEL